MLALYILFMAVIKVTAKFLSDSPDSFGPKAFGISLLAQSLTNPLNYLLSHVLYFGPVFLFIFFNFKNFTKTIVQQGLGTFAFTILYLLLLSAMNPGNLSMLCPC